ncbi:MAG: hypothetical protein ISN29_00080 [Gammaproteobacteria bacterium AqS3]|nr:hypothetical protein [Gammaproteobacteria bacterium AqS3]
MSKKRCFWVLHQFGMAVLYVLGLVLVLNLFVRPAFGTPAIGIISYCDDEGDYDDSPFRCLDVKEIEDKICKDAYRDYVKVNRPSIGLQNVVLGCILNERIQRLENAIREKGVDRWHWYKYPLGSNIQVQEKFTEDALKAARHLTHRDR